MGNERLGLELHFLSGERDLCCLAIVRLFSVNSSKDFVGKKDRKKCNHLRMRKQDGFISWVKRKFYLF